MKKLLSCIIISIIVLGGLGAAVTATHQNQVYTEKNISSVSRYVDELDQSMTDYDGSLPVGRTNIFGYYVNLSIAQSFTPQIEVLTRTLFLMARNSSTAAPCFLAIRENLTETDLARVTVEPSEFPIVNATPTEEQLAWIEFNFDDLWVTPGQTYYIVIYTANTTENYYWISGNGTNIYQNGTVLLSIDNGNTWSELIDADGCFKTYGLHETFLQITMKGGFPGASFVIKNVGNYTAWDVTVNNTISGGLVLIGRHFTSTISELRPGEEMILRTGFIIGFGKISLSLRVSAANVKEISSQATATILLFFIIILQ